MTRNLIASLLVFGVASSPVVLAGDSGVDDVFSPLFRTSMEASLCPDNIVQDAEQCDDNNAEANDGCAANCRFFNCGDGVLDGPYEECDDGNPDGGDGCNRRFCFVETGYQCIGEPSVCLSICGDGVIASNEQCDDENLLNNDGCSDTCTIEAPYTCIGSPSVCQSPFEINCNDSLDNDGNGLIDCADARCALHCNASVGACAAGQTAVVYTSADVPKSIPDNQPVGVGSAIAVGGQGQVQRVVMRLNATHTFDSDLDIALLAPDATSVETSTDNGASGANYTNTIFNSACATAITSGSAPFTGCFRPESSYVAFNGKQAQGAWQLRIADDASGDIGTLNAWSLALCVSQ